MCIVILWEIYELVHINIKLHWLRIFFMCANNLWGENNEIKFTKQ